MHSLIIFCAKYVIVFVALAWGWAWLHIAKGKRLELLVATALAAIVALVLSRLAGQLYYDPRPFVTEHVQPLITHAADNGFPSDHALLTGTLTAVVFAYSKKIAGIMAVLTLLVGTSRVLAKVHSPVDIAGAWIIAGTAALAGYYGGRWILQRYQKQAPRPPQLH